MKLTPTQNVCEAECTYHRGGPTKRVYVILIEFAFNVLNHQTRLTHLRVTNHPNLDNDIITRRAQIGAFRGVSSIYAILICAFCFHYLP